MMPQYFPCCLAFSGFDFGLHLRAFQVMYPSARFRGVMHNVQSLVLMAYVLGQKILKATEENVRRLRNRARFVDLAR